MGFLRAEARAIAGRRKKLEEERAGQLLPGIPNEVSVNEIAAKFLTWKDLCVISCVSRGWCQAVRNREVYRARLRSHSTETLCFDSFGCCIVISSKPTYEVYLQSTKNNHFYQSPPIPGFFGCWLAPLDGRLFVLGGAKGGMKFGVFSNQVYVLDLAGQKEWKRCASMKQARGFFGGAVMNGKIYVFGGCQSRYDKNGDRSQEPVCGSEVYDPEKDTWTSISAMPSWRCFQNVTQEGPVLVMRGGHIFGPPQLDSFGKYKTTEALSVEIYHPGNDVWKVVSPDGKSSITDLHLGPRGLLGPGGYLSL